MVTKFENYNIKAGPIAGGSGGGGAGRAMSDRELMRHVVETHDLKQLLRTTAMPGRSYNTPLSGVDKMVRRAGRPGRAPSVAARNKRMRDASVLQMLRFGQNAVVTLLQELGIDPLDGPLSTVKVGSGQWSHPRYTRCVTCNRPEVGWRSTGNCSEVCTTITNNVLPAMPPPNDYIGINVGVFTQPGYLLPVPTRHKAAHFTRTVAGTFGAWTQDTNKVLARTSTALIAGSRNMSSAPRARRPVERLRGYRKAGHEIVVVPGRNGEGVMDGPPVRITHREVPTKLDKKSKKKLGFSLIGAYHSMTEINDFFDALAEAIPGNPCGKMPGFQKMACVIEHWPEINAGQALVNIAANEIEDRIIGRLQGKLSDALKKAGGPNSTQVQQFARQLAQYTKGVL